MIIFIFNLKILIMLIKSISELFIILFWVFWFNPQKLQIICSLNIKHANIKIIKIIIWILFFNVNIFLKPYSDIPLIIFKYINKKNAIITFEISKNQGLNKKNIDQIKVSAIPLSINNNTKYFILHLFHFIKDFHF